MTLKLYLECWDVNKMRDKVPKFPLYIDLILKCTGVLWKRYALYYTVFVGNTKHNGMAKV